MDHIAQVRMNHHNNLNESINDNLPGGSNSTSFSKIKKHYKKKACIFINQHYIAFKLLFFGFLGAQGVFINFRSLFSRHLGLSTAQSGTIWAVDRIFGIFSPPLLGAISDKTQKPRDVLAWIFSICAALLCVTIFIPRQAGNSSINCEDYNLYPIMFPRSALSAEDSEYVRKQCYTFQVIGETDLRSICLNNTINSTEVEIRNSSVSLDQFGRMVDNCESSEQTLFLSQQPIGNGTSRVYMCKNGECKEDSGNASAVVGRSFTLTTDNDRELPSGDPVLKSCVCTPEQDDKPSYDTTFWTFLFINLAVSLALLSGQGLVDSFVIEQLPTEKRHLFGYQRLWGSVGYGMFVLLGGYFKDVIFENFPETATTNIPFLPIFLLSAFCCFLLSATVKFTKDRNVSNAGNQSSKFRLSNIKLLLGDSKIFMFIVFTSAVGFSLGAGETYAFVLAVEKVGASGTVLGLSLGLASVLDVFMYVASTRLLKMFGTNVVMVVGMQVLSTKLLLYTFCTQPWHFILVEQIRGLSWGVTWTAVCNHASKLSPPGLNATMMGLVSMGAWGFGYGLASFVGGILYDSFGGDTMFRIFFAAATAVVIFYSLFVIITREKGSSKMRKEEVKEAEEELKYKSIEDLNNNV